MRPTTRYAILAVSLVLCRAPARLRADDAAFVTERDVKVPMRDGVRLSANVFRPPGEGKLPAILLRTPYGKFDEKSPDAKRYTAAGFAMVVQDCRGRGASEGSWDPFSHEPEDGFDTQEWVARQTWSNGDVGTAGGSYVGWTQWASAANASNHLKAMVPVVPFANVYDDIAFPGGAFQLALLMGWGTSVGGIQLAPDKLQAAYRHLPLRSFGDQFEKKVGYLDDWVGHPSYDEYWRKRGIDRRFADVTVPILNIGGWYDIFSKATIEMVDRVRESSRDRLARRSQFVVMGPWAHGVGVRKVGELDFGADAAVDLGDLQLRWFQYWLEGKETGVQDWAPYRVFVMGENRWRDENEWPLKRAQITSYYLHSRGAANTSGGDGTLSTTKPGSEPPDTFVYDPSEPVPTHGGNNLTGATIGPLDQAVIEGRKDVLVYTSEPLEVEVEVTGPVKALLYASTTATDTDFTAKLVDVHADGKAYNLCDGILRGRFREGMSQEKPLEPGKPHTFEIDLWVTSNVFLKGHRIRVEVSSSNFPRFDRNPNTGKPFGTDTELVKATQTVHHDVVRPSQVILPIVPR